MSEDTELKPRRLTNKQERFCQELLVDWNATQAAIRAGYSKRSARQQGSDNLAKPYILQRIQEVMKRLETETGVTAKRALQETGRIAFSRIDSYLEFGPDGVTLRRLEDMTEDEIRAIGEVSEVVHEKGGSIKFKLHDKMKALDQLHRIFGSYSDSVEHSGTVGIDIKEVRFIYPDEGKGEGE